MSLPAITLVLTLLGQAPPSTTSAPAPSDAAGKLQILHVPLDKIETFLPTDEVIRTLPRKEFDTLAKKFLAEPRRPKSDLPVAIRLTATVDPNTGVLTGSMTLDLLGSSNIRTLSPWNLQIEKWTKMPADTRWGMSAQGNLTFVEPLPAADKLTAEWRYAPRRQSDRWDYELRLPICAVGELELRLPPNWRLLGSALEDKPKGDTRRLLFGGSPGVDFGLRPSGATSKSRGAMTWQANANYRVEEANVEMQAEIQLEALHEPADQVTLQVDRRIRPQDLRCSTPAQWSVEDRGDDTNHWIAQFRHPPLGPVQIRFRSALPAFEAGDWRLPLFAIADSLPRGFEATLSVAPTIRIGQVRAGAWNMVAAQVDEAGRYRLGFGHSGARFVELARSAPSLRFANSTPEIETTNQLFLDISRDRVRLAAVIEWKCLTGVLSQPSVVLPTGWEVLSATPIGSRRVRVETTEEGQNIARLALERRLTAGQSIQTLIWAAPKPGFVLPGITKLENVTLPEIRPLEVTPSGPSTYTLFVDSSLPYGKDNLPPPKRSAATFPDAVDAPKSEPYTFEFQSPMRPLSLNRLTRTARFHADLSQSLEWTGVDWLASVRIAVRPERGQLVELELLSTQELPKDLVWESDNGNGHVDSFVKLNPEKPGANAPRYRMTFVSPLENPTKLSASWRLAPAAVDLPVLNTPSADSAAISLAVKCRTGLPIKVVTHGVTETPLAANTVDNDGLVWLGSYPRWTTDLRWEASRAELSSANALESNDVPLALLTRRISVGRFQQIHELQVEIQLNRPTRPRLRLPANARLWSVTIDGADVETQGDVRAEFSLPEIAVGRHTVALTFDLTTRNYFGLAKINSVQPFQNFAVLPAPTQVRLFDAVRPLWVRGGAVRSVTYFGAGHQNEPALFGVNDSRAHRDVWNILSQAFTAHRDAGETDVGAMLVRMRSVLPSGWRLVVDRLSPISDLPRDAANEEDSFSDWLGRSGLSVHFGENTVLFADSHLQGVSYEADAGQVGVNWVDPVADALLNQEKDPSNRFTTPAAWRSTRASTRSNGEDANINPDQRTANNPGWQDWTFSPAPGSPAESLSLMVGTPESLLRLNGAVVVGSVLVLLLGYRKRRLQAASIGLMIVGFVGVALVNLMRGFPRAETEGVIWVAIGIGGLGWLVHRWLNRPQPPVRNERLAAGHRSAPPMLFLDQGLVANSSKQGIVSLVATLLVLSTAQAQAPRVIIPYTSKEAPAPLDFVYLPDSLLQKLKSQDLQPVGPALLTRARFDGSMLSPGLSRWTARLDYTIENRTGKDITLVIPLVGVKVIEVRVGKKPVPFLPPGGSLGLQLSVGAGPSAELEIDFHAPILGSAPAREITFAIPAAPRNELRFELGAQTVKLGPESEPAGLYPVGLAASNAVAGSFAPARRIRLAWLDNTVDSRVARLTTTGVALVDVSPTSVDLIAVFQQEIADGQVNRLEFALPKEFVVRRVDAPRLRDWTMDEPPAGPNGNRKLGVDFNTAITGRIDVRIHCHLPIADLTKVSIPMIRPLGIPGRPQPPTPVSTPLELGLRVADGWSVDWGAGGAPPAETNAREFLSAWEKAGQPTLEKVARATRATAETSFPALRIARLPARYSVKSAVDVRIEDDAKELPFTADYELSPTLTPIRSLTADVPMGLEIFAVQGGNVAFWSRDGDRLSVLPRQGLTTPWSIRVRGRWKCASHEEKSNTTRFAIRPLAWNESAGGGGTFDLKAPRNLRVEAKEVNAGKTTEIDLTKRVDWNGAGPGYDITLTPAPITLDVRSATTLIFRQGIPFVEGRFEIGSPQGLPKRLEFRAATTVADVRWKISEGEILAGAPSDQELTWSLVPSPSNGGRQIVEWSTLAIADRAGVFDVPKIRLVGYPIRERWVLVENHGPGQLREVEVNGLAPSAVPSDPAMIPGEQGRAANPTFAYVYQATTKDWTLKLAGPRETGEPEPRLHTLFAEHSALPMQAGRIVWGSRWRTVALASAHATIRFPTTAKVRSVSLNRRQLSQVDSQGDRLTLALLRMSAPQEIETLWETNEMGSTGEIRLPWVEGAADYPEAIRWVRHAGPPLYSPAFRVSLLGWQARRCEQLLHENALLTKLRMPASADLLSELLDHRDRMDERAPAGAGDADMDGLRKAITLIESASAEPGHGPGRHFLPVTFVSGLTETPASQVVDLFLAPRPIHSATRQNADRWLELVGRHLGPVLARLAASLTGLALVLTACQRRLRASAIAVPLLAVGLLWRHVDSAPHLGLALLFASFVLALTDVYRWFQFSPKVPHNLPVSV